MQNSKMTRVARILPLILCLGGYAKNVIADNQSKSITNNKKLGNNKDVANMTPKIDEEFLMFLAEIDVQAGVEVDPLDMLDLDLDLAGSSPNVDAKSINMKQVQEKTEPKENN